MYLWLGLVAEYYVTVKYSISVSMHKEKKQEE